MSALVVLDAAAVRAALSPRVAADALEAALRGGLDADADPPRTSLAAAAGEVLVMASAASGVVGVKLASIAPGNPARGLPRIQGTYVLFDAVTLAPAALLDAAALTEVRTAAVSMVALRHAGVPAAPRLLVFGTGPQAAAHVAAVCAEHEPARVDVAGRSAERTAALAAVLRGTGVPAAAVVGAGALRRAVRDADVICCCTTAREPLLDDGDVAAGATIVAVGSHEPGARELPAALLARSLVVVETPRVALREAGDVVLALAEGALAPKALVPLAALVRGEEARDLARPLVFKSVGMAWQDAVLAAAALRRAPSCP